MRLGMTVGLSYAYTDVKIPAAPFPFAGNAAVPLGSPFPVNVVYTPPNAASAYIDYEMPVGKLTLRSHLDANYADAQYAFQTEFADVSPTKLHKGWILSKTIERVWPFPS